MSYHFMLIFGCGLLALIYSLLTARYIMSAPDGTPKMQEIAAAIQEGAQAYLNRQYTAIGIVGIIICIALGLFLGLHVAVGFIIGAVLSGLAGYAGMNVSVRANVRTAAAAKESMKAALGIA